MTSINLSELATALPPAHLEPPLPTRQHASGPTSLQCEIYRESGNTVFKVGGPSLSLTTVTISALLNIDQCSQVMELMVYHLAGEPQLVSVV